MVLMRVTITEKSIIFVTNNATKSRRNYKGKFDKLGIQAEVVSKELYVSISGYASLTRCMKEEIFGSAYAAAVYLSSVINFPKDKKVYVVGMKGLEEELAEEGISYLGGTVGCYNTVHCDIHN